MELLGLLIALAFAAGCDIYDVVLTEKGIKAGVAVEEDTLFVGAKPSAVALYLRDSLYTALATLPSLLALLVFQNVPLFWGGLIGPVLVGVKHITGARQWATLLAGGTITAPQTAWQKFWQG